MVRMQVHLTEEQIQQLRKESAERGKSVAELVRNFVATSAADANPENRLDL